MQKSLYQQELEKQATCTSEELYKGPIFSIRRDTLQFSDHTHRWDFVVHPGAVAMIPVKKSGEIILIQQWRRAIGKIIYELPAGIPEKNEALQQAAIRELQEEIGYQPNTLIDLGSYYSTPGFCTEQIHLFIAQDLIPSILPKDLHEAIDIVEMDLDKALVLISSSQIQDLKTIAGILRYKQWLSE